MDVPAKGQVGGIESDDGTRKRLAGESRGWRCGVCGRRNMDILEEQERLAKEDGDHKKEQEKVPEELTLVYKEDLKGTAGAVSSEPTQVPAASSEGQKNAASAITAAASVVTTPPAAPRLAPAQPVRQQPATAQQANGHVDDVQLDAAIWVVSGLLIILISRMLVRMFS